MLVKFEQISDAVKSSIGSLWIYISVIAVNVSGQEGNGCGLTVLGTESGTLASQNYPGTYPADTWCRWTLRAPQGRTLRFLFGDFDVEQSPGCRNGSLTITASDGTHSIGPLCGYLKTSDRNVTVTSDEVTVVFNSGPHHSGRGFLLSYTTDQHPDLISCLQRGSHFISLQFSVYCPAGCKDVTGDIHGHSEQGYRDTSVLCKAAVHAGVMSDSLGGQATVSRERSLKLYESSFANGILSKMGSLSEKKLLFSQECNRDLTVSGFNASSLWETVDSLGQRVLGAPRNKDSESQFLHWVADSYDKDPWLELELTEKSTVTGIITSGSPDFYIESYTLLFSKDRKIWKVYKASQSREKKVFEAHVDGHLRVLNSLFPPVTARYLRLQPSSWHGQASAQVQVLGCSVPRVPPRLRSAGGLPSLKVDVSTTALPKPDPTEGLVIIKDSSQSFSQPMIVAVGVVLGLILCMSCLMAGVWWKRRRKAAHMKKYLLAKGYQGFQVKSVPCPESELISYPLERNVHDALPNPPLNDYAEPEVAAGGQKLSSTFRPTVEEGYTTPFTFSHYDTPGRLPEYAEPLPPEPEYATPFSDQPPEPNLATPQGNQLNTTRGLSVTAPSSGKIRTSQAVYDCPSDRELSNGYCTPSLHTSGARPASVLYSEPQYSDTSLQHTYEEPF